MPEKAQERTLTTGKFIFAGALLGSIGILGTIETAPTEIFSRAFYIYSHAWEIKLWLATPFLVSLIAGIPVWKDADRAEIKQKTAGTVLLSLGSLLMFIYGFFLDVWFQHSTYIPNP